MTPYEHLRAAERGLRHEAEGEKNTEVAVALRALADDARDMAERVGGLLGVAPQATRHIYAPSIGAASAEDLCDDHADEALRDDGDRYEVTPAPPGRPCGRCAERKPSSSP